MKMKTFGNWEISEHLGSPPDPPSAPPRLIKELDHHHSFLTIRIPLVWSESKAVVMIIDDNQKWRNRMVITDHSTKGRLLVRKLKRQKCNCCFMSIANQHIYHQHQQSENLHLRKLYLQCWLFNGIEPWAVLSKLLLSLVTIDRRTKSLAWTLGGMIVEIFQLNIGIKFVLPPIISVLAAKRSDLSSL